MSKPGSQVFTGPPDASALQPACLAEWFRGATSSSLTAVYIFEPLMSDDGTAADFRFVFANALGDELLNRDGHDLVGLTLRQVLPPSRIEKVVQQCRDVMSGGESMVEEFEVVEYPANMRWLRHEVVPIQGGVVITSENISLRKQAECALAQREEWFRAAAEGNLNALFINQAVYDEAGDVVDFTFAHVNEQGGRLVGMDPATMVGRSICELFPVNRSEGYFERYRQVFLERRSVVDEFPINSPTLKAKWLRQIAVPWSGGVALSAEDITAEVERKHELEARQRMLAAFIEQIPGPAWIADDQGIARVYNQHFARLGGDRLAMHDGPVSLDALFDPVQSAIYRSQNAELIAHGIARRNPEAGPRADGSLGVYDVFRFPIDAAGERLAGGLALDVTDREQLQRQANLLGAIASEANDAIFALALDGTVVQWSASAERLFGYGSEDALGQPLAMLFPPEMIDELDQIRAKVEGGMPVIRHPSRILRRDGQPLQVDMSLATYRMNDAGEACIAVLASDVSARVLAEARADYLTSHDASTGLLNREGFIQQLSRRVEDDDRPLVARISLREAETLRDLLGSPMVDRLVAAYALRMLTSLAPHAAEIGRDGPDQLLLSLAGGARGEAALLAAWPDLSREIALDDQRYSLNPRLGYALASDGADENGQRLLRASDLAHGQAVARQTTAAIAFEDGMVERLQRRVEIQRELANAVGRDELSLVLQPVFSDAGGVVGLESLVRWSSPLLGFVSPGEFIPIAEESSAIVALGDWVLEQSCRELRRLDGQGGDLLYVAVNVAEAQLARGNFAERIGQLLARHEMPPHRLELEITERTLMADTTVHQANLRDLRALGVKLSVDDFGTGYSSLSYLLRFAVDKIKIDRSFIAGLGVHGSHDALVRTLVALADSLGLECVSEGVETQDQLSRLRTLGCSMFQGYLLARPMAPAALREWLAGCGVQPR
ncbi:MAG: EAL domain-containing protein [Arenimonas sp.]|uniref:sensor domain-containing protein n=1 Tax=Arenimonas sp. TaxID=1872635 RepID=UPI0025C5AEC7|nr:EAL domain-containing protein [Arenimonas sp.]MBW8368383.1 EAL domain-containing protein [Arenimonas sp.]